MSNIALLYGDIIIYWNQIIVVLGIIACFVYAFAMRPFTKIKRRAVIFWFILAFVLSFIFARLLYYYCHAEQFVSFEDALSVFFDDHYSVAGIIFGTLLSALIIRLFRLVRNVYNLLDTAFPGVVLAIALFRLSYYFTNTYHSKIIIKNPVWERLPFSISATDAAGNTYYVFAPFLISFIILFLTVMIFTLFIRKRLKRSGDLFRYTFIFFALSEMVLEGTRNDSLKLHLMYLSSLNRYVSFISFSMLVIAICMLIMFFVNYRRAAIHTGNRRAVFPLVTFLISFICFGVCEYLVQRYTASDVLFHWIQAFFAVIMAISTIAVVVLKNTKRKRKKVLSRQHM